MVGTSLALALRQQGYPVVAAASRSFSSAQSLAGLVQGCVAFSTVCEAAEASDVTFITVPDDAIGPVASSISWRRDQAVVHCSGAASLDVLEAARRQGAATGAFHPLQTFSSVEGAVKSISGITFAIEGKGEMRTFLEEMSIALGGNPIFLRPEDKPLYHASLVMLGGFLTGLAGAVAELWRHFGIDQADALRSLVPMIQGDAVALRSIGIPCAVTGPYVRGDIVTIRKHLEALRSTAPEILPTYCHLALTALPFALEKGNLSQEQAAEIIELLRVASVERRCENA